MGLREEDSMKAFLGFKLQVERISVAIVHLYCTFCEQNKVYIWTQEENLSKKSGWSIGAIFYLSQDKVLM